MEIGYDYIREYGGCIGGRQVKHRDALESFIRKIMIIIIIISIIIKRKIPESNDNVDV